MAPKEMIDPSEMGIRPVAANALHGIGFMCAGVSTFPFMNAAVKLLSPNYPAAQITWARFTGHLLVMLIVFLPHYRGRLLRTRQPLVQIGRSGLMLMSNLVFVMAIGHVPLATASAIGFTSPLIVTAMSVPLLRESVGWRRWPIKNDRGPERYPMKNHPFVLDDGNAYDGTTVPCRLIERHGSLVQPRSAADSLNPPPWRCRGM